MPPKKAARKGAASGNPIFNRVAADIVRRVRLRTEATARTSRTGRATRSSANTALIRRTALQAERDSVADTISSTWLRRRLKNTQNTRPNRDPRGIENPEQHCYWNSVLQNLMHVPIFLNWIRSHTFTDRCQADIGPTQYPKQDVTKPKSCARCEMKRLVETYWGPTDPSIPIRMNDMALISLKNIAFYTTQLDRPNQQDAHEALVFLLNEDHGLFKGDQTWRNQANAIFGMNVVPFYTCKTCGATRQGNASEDYQLSLTVDWQLRTLIRTIQVHFQPESLDLACVKPKCTGRQVSSRPVIRAAPRVLIIHLQIYFLTADGTQKILHPLRIFEDLDLTPYQENTSTPLRYKLSGIVAHRGPRANSGHYVACVRSAGTHGFYQISDSSPVRPLSAQEFTENPQTTPQHGSEDGLDQDFLDYMLTYVRKDGGRMVTELR